MQDMMPQLGAGAQLVRSYGPEGFRIGQDSHAGHVLVLPAQTVAWSGELTIEAMLPIFGYVEDAHSTVPLPLRERLGGGRYEAQTLPLTAPPQPSPYGGGGDVAPLAQSIHSARAGEGFIELLIIGTGKRHEMIAPELKRALKVRGVGVDTMDTGAACRTFNVLLGEGRRVAAALLVPKG